MTRKHFRIIADALKGARPEMKGDFLSMAKCEQWALTCRRLATELQGCNPRFDRGRFLAACESQGVRR